MHFFLDDYRFEAVWANPHRGLDRIAVLGAALTPDFSMWRDMPLVMQQWQVYRSRWCGAWLLACGIDIVPTVTWAGPRTFEFAFAGLARHTTVAISTVGTRGREVRRLFEAGCEALIERVAPAAVLVYGNAEPAERVFGGTDIDVSYYPGRWADGR